MVVVNVVRQNRNGTSPRGKTSVQCKRRPPWGNLLGGKPIERHVWHFEEKIDLGEEYVRRMQFLQMLQKGTTGSLVGNLSVSHLPTGSLQMRGTWTKRRAQDGRHKSRLLKPWHPNLSRLRHGRLDHRRRPHRQPEPRKADDS